MTKKKIKEIRSEEKSSGNNERLLVTTDFKTDNNGRTFYFIDEDGCEICLESCLNGFCVGYYDKNKDLIIDKKICTDVPDYGKEPLSRVYAANKAVEIANEIWHSKK